MERWNDRDIEMLCKYYPRYDLLADILHRDVHSIRRKAVNIGITKNREKKALKKKPKTIALISNVKEIEVKKPSYKEARRFIEDKIETAFSDLLTARGESVQAWRRALDRYNYWLLREQQLENNRIYYS